MKWHLIFLVSLFSGVVSYGASPEEDFMMLWTPELSRKELGDCRLSKAIEQRQVEYKLNTQCSFRGLVCKAGMKIVVQSDGIPPEVSFFQTAADSKDQYCMQGDLKFTGALYDPRKKELLSIIMRPQKGEKIVFEGYETSDSLEVILGSEWRKHARAYLKKKIGPFDFILTDIGMGTDKVIQRLHFITKEPVKMKYFTLPRHSAGEIAEDIFSNVSFPGQVQVGPYFCKEIIFLGENTRPEYCKLARSYELKEGQVPEETELRFGSDSYEPIMMGPLPRKVELNGKTYPEGTKLRKGKSGDWEEVEELPSLSD